MRCPVCGTTPVDLSRSTPITGEGSGYAGGDDNISTDRLLVGLAGKEMLKHSPDAEIVLSLARVEALEWN